MTWHGDYAAFLRQRRLEKCRAPAANCSMAGPVGAIEPNIPAAIHPLASVVRALLSGVQKYTPYQKKFRRTLKEALLGSLVGGEGVWLGVVLGPGLGSDLQLGLQPCL